MAKKLIHLVGRCTNHLGFSDIDQGLQCGIGPLLEGNEKPVGQVHRHFFTLKDGGVESLVISFG